MVTQVDQSSLKTKYRARFTAALLKITSRCNLNCDYCYVYNHVDQSWKNQPKIMSEEVIKQFSQKLKEYLGVEQINEFDIIFHGGEPLLFGSGPLLSAVNIIRNQINNENIKINFSVQTNGTLLSNEVIDDLFNAKISISMSLDGPKNSNDLHRLDHNSQSTFNDAFQGLNYLLKKQSELFQGVIAVIDPYNDPRDLFEFFSPMNLPRLDFLLPDATHCHPPIGRDSSSHIYRDWLLEAFELWFRQYSYIPIRWFDSILASRLGVPSQTDVMGFGSVCLLVVETDGHYSDHDVFKITRPNGALLDKNVFTASIAELSVHETILEHGFRLSSEGISKECSQCPALEACGGGSIPHRYHEERGLDAPTVYCHEIFSIISKASTLLSESLVINNEIPVFKDYKFEKIEENCSQWRLSTDNKAKKIMNLQDLDKLTISAAAILLKESLQKEKSLDLIDVCEIRPFWLDTINIQSSQKWLTAPFEDTIEVLSFESIEVQEAIKLLEKVKLYLEEFNPAIVKGMGNLLTDLIFVKSKVGDENGIFSFSDDTAPNVIYIAPSAGGKLLDADDLADSILHEFLHQVLYHLDGEEPLLFDYKFPRFPAPWRGGFRDSSGFLHGTFVFTNLSLYWNALSHANLSGINKEKSLKNAIKFKDQARYGISSLLQFALLTPQGITFVESLAQALNITDIKLSPPGLLF
ncbi:cyclophane-forming radical SAM/SPASM peptide maturase YhhB [Paenibacillus planticolens]|uniref:FxsB family radical SAM/SPASM domain protein n=1 Tax=Paenibacillus planticolens TaxID=2654976 RepID=A0ABX1ZHB2_9BACL|nr:cyclophane-forming radical SAM/SPASM peptide maturase YhhB [Paenibacillus planticolens]NOU99483.1 FxsB family radical SAM/SPASM domain protein [Paenibacillus planticolens]